MPIHDWSRADDAEYHDFQRGWACELRRRLNRGVLPQPLYALHETVELRPVAAFLEMPEPDGPWVRRTWEEALLDATERPPQTAMRRTDDRRQYACCIVTVRDDLHQPRAAIVWGTRQDLETPYRRDALVNLAVGAVTRGIHMLVIELFPPPRRDSMSLHHRIWDRIQGGPFEPVTDKPLTVASYDAGDELTAYVDPLAVGDRLPDAPLFLAPGLYVNVPLEQTYAAAWGELPQPIRDLIAPPESDEPLTR